MASTCRAAKDYKYDICLSFAGEDRQYVDRVAKELKEKGINVFYDKYEIASLWGKDLYEHFDFVYRNAARYCVIFISKAYASKVWTNHERKSAQARAFRDNQEYILPARFDNTTIPGLLPTVGYVSLKEITPAELAILIIQKLGPRRRMNCLPDDLARLYSRLKLRKKHEKAIVQRQANHFFTAIKRMNEAERRLIFEIFYHGCACELPDNIHIELELLRRTTGLKTGNIKRTLSKLTALGFLCKMKKDRIEDKFISCSSDVIVLEYHVMVDEDFGGPATDLAYEMMNGLMEGRCIECAFDLLRRADFSDLSG